MEQHARNWHRCLISPSEERTHRTRTLPERFEAFFINNRSECLSEPLIFLFLALPRVNAHALDLIQDLHTLQTATQNSTQRCGHHCRSARSAAHTVQCKSCSELLSSRPLIETHGFSQPKHAHSHSAYRIIERQIYRKDPFHSPPRFCAQ